MSAPALDEKDPASLAAEYLELVASADHLMERARLVKDNLVGLLPFEEGFKANYGSATIIWAKGRRTEKVDQKTVRRELILAGIAPELVEKAYAKATSVSVGQPTMRVCGTDQEVE